MKGPFRYVGGIVDVMLLVAASILLLALFLPVWLLWWACCWVIVRTDKALEKGLDW